MIERIARLILIMLFMVGLKIPLLARKLEELSETGFDTLDVR